METKASFDPERCPHSQALANLQASSSEEEIRLAFVEWNRQVFIPMIEDILTVLERAYLPYAKMTLIPDRETDDKKTYISAAIEALKTQKTIFGERIEQISNALPLSQFIAVMRHTMPIDECDTMGISWGMEDAGIKERYTSEFWPVVEFRVGQAWRLPCDTDDNKFQKPLRAIWAEHRKEKTITGLDNIGEDREGNIGILVAYWHDVLHGMVLAIINMDSESRGEEEASKYYWNVLTECPSKSMTTMDRLLAFYESLEGKVKVYIGTMRNSLTQSTEFQTASQKFFDHL